MATVAEMTVEEFGSRIEKRIALIIQKELKPICTRLDKIETRLGVVETEMASVKSALNTNNQIMLNTHGFLKNYFGD